MCPKSTGARIRCCSFKDSEFYNMCASVIANKYSSPCSMLCYIIKMYVLCLYVVVNSPLLEYVIVNF